MLDFNTFCDHLALRLDLDASSWHHGTGFDEDLGLDSLQMLELLVLMDELGAEVIEEQVPYLRTLGDLYDHYETRLSAEGRFEKRG